MTRRNQPAQPTEAEREESLERELRWRRQYEGLTHDGTAERAKQLAAMPPRPPAFAPPGEALPPSKPKRK